MCVHTHALARARVHTYTQTRTHNYVHTRGISQRPRHAPQRHGPGKTHARVCSRCGLWSQGRTRTMESLVCGRPDPDVHEQSSCAALSPPLFTDKPTGRDAALIPVVGHDSPRHPWTSEQRLAEPGRPHPNPHTGEAPPTPHLIRPGGLWGCGVAGSLARVPMGLATTSAWRPSCTWWREQAAGVAEAAMSPWAIRAQAHSLRDP